MLQIYRTTPMPKCDFNKVALQPFLKSTYGWHLLYYSAFSLIKNLIKVVFGARFLDWRQPCNNWFLVIMLLAIIGQLVGWLVGWKRSFLRHGSKDFSNFLHEVRRLGDLAGFLKKILHLEIFVKRSPNQPSIRHFDFFLENSFHDFFGFWPDVSTKYHLQFE